MAGENVVKCFKCRVSSDVLFNLGGTVNEGPARDIYGDEHVQELHLCHQCFNFDKDHYTRILNGINYTTDESSRASVQPSPPLPSPPSPSPQIHHSIQDHDSGEMTLRPGRSIQEHDSGEMTLRPGTISFSADSVLVAQLNQIQDRIQGAPLRPRAQQNEDDLMQRKRISGG